MLGFEWWELLIGSAAFVAALLAVPPIIQAERVARCQHKFEKHGAVLLCHGCGLTRELPPECNHIFATHRVFEANDDDVEGRLPIDIRYVCRKCGLVRSLRRDKDNDGKAEKID